MQRTQWITSIVIALLLIGCAPAPSTPSEKSFDGERAYRDVVTQVDFGPRIPGSAAHAKFRDWLEAEATSAGWSVDVQQRTVTEKTIYNIMLTRNNESPVILLVAHYDSRAFADSDPSPEKRTQPVPGANDGASGVAVLLELARTLPQDSVSVWLLFVDAEDQGAIDGQNWIVGSTLFAGEMQIQPQAVVVLDMIGDADLNIYQERNSDPELIQEIWGAAKSLGYESFFIPEDKYRLIDDHLPFIGKEIRAVDIVDFDYPYWHTTHDTPDKLSAQSLQIVGETILQWILTYHR